MGSSFVSVRICQKQLNRFFHQGTKTFFARKSFVCKSQLPLSARYLCTRHSKSNQGSRHTDGRNTEQGALKKDPDIRHGQEELWGKSSNLRQKPSFPKSVFAAGTAKRVSEMQKRQVARASQDDEQLVEEPRGRSTRGEGRTYENCLLDVFWYHFIFLR